MKNTEITKEDAKSLKIYFELLMAFYLFFGLSMGMGLDFIPDEYFQISRSIFFVAGVICFLIAIFRYRDTYKRIVGSTKE